MSANYKEHNMPTRIERKNSWGLHTATRLVCISDIHGHYQTFLNLINKLKGGNHFNEKRDFLLINGDIVDRGLGSAALLNYLKSLHNICAMGDKIKCTLGNHEYDWLMAMLMPDSRTPKGTLNRDFWLNGKRGAEATIDSFGGISEAFDFLCDNLDAILSMLHYCVQIDLPTNKKIFASHALNYGTLLKEGNHQVGVNEENLWHAVRENYNESYINKLAKQYGGMTWLFGHQAFARIIQENQHNRHPNVQPLDNGCSIPTANQFQNQSSGNLAAVIFDARTGEKLSTVTEPPHPSDKNNELNKEMLRKNNIIISAELRRKSKTYKTWLSHNAHKAKLHSNRFQDWHRALTSKSLVIFTKGMIEESAEQPYQKVFAQRF